MKYHLPVKLPDFLSVDDAGWIRITGHRISLVDIVVYFNDGLSAENLATRFPTISLALIHHIIAFYLDHSAAVDEYVQKALAETHRVRSATPTSPAMVELRKRAFALHDARMKAVHAS